MTLAPDDPSPRDPNVPRTTDIITGITNGPFAGYVSRMMASGGKLNVYIATDGRPGPVGSIGFSTEEAIFIRRTLCALESYKKNINYKENSRAYKRGLYFYSTPAGQGSSSVNYNSKNDLFYIRIQDEGDSALTMSEREDILWAIGRAHGLNEPFGDGTTPWITTADTMMSWNQSELSRGSYTLLDDKAFTIAGFPENHIFALTDSCSHDNGASVLSS